MRFQYVYTKNLIQIFIIDSFTRNRKTFKDRDYVIFDKSNCLTFANFFLSQVAEILARFVNIDHHPV